MSSADTYGVAPEYETADIRNTETGGGHPNRNVSSIGGIVQELESADGTAEVTGKEALLTESIDRDILHPQTEEDLGR